MSEARVERRLTAILAADVVGIRDRWVPTRRHACGVESYPPRIGRSQDRRSIAAVSSKQRATDFWWSFPAWSTPCVAPSTYSGRWLSGMPVTERNAHRIPRRHQSGRHHHRWGRHFRRRRQRRRSSRNVGGAGWHLRQPRGARPGTRQLAFAFEDMGEQQVKNIARPVRVHRIRIDAAAAALPAAAPHYARPARQAVDCGAAVPEHERRPPSRSISPTAWSRRSSPPSAGSDGCS